MDNQEDEESVRRWKEAEQRQDTLQAFTMDMLGFDKMRAATQEPQRRRIGNREDGSSDDSLQVVEDTAEVTRPARKRQRAGGR